MKRGTRIRPENDEALLVAIDNYGESRDTMANVLALANCPRNIRFLDTVLKNLMDLTIEHSKFFELLTADKRALLDNCFWARDALASIKDRELSKDIYASPKEDGIGILGYAVTAAPIYGILLLDHPHQATRQYFRSIVAKVVSHYLYMRNDFSFEVHKTMLNGKDISRSPIPLHSRMSAIEKALRDVSSGINTDHLSVIPASLESNNVRSIIELLKGSRHNNSYSDHAYELGRIVDSFIEEDSSSSRSLRIRKNRMKARSGLSYGTLIAGDYTISQIDDTSCCTLESYSNDSIRSAINQDCHPAEVEDDHPVILIDDEGAASLPASAKQKTSERHAQQIARSQQMSPLRKGGLKSHLIMAIQDLADRLAEADCLHGLLYHAIIATGRPLKGIDQFDITQGAALEDATASIELDIDLRVWRIKVNQPEIVHRDPVAGAIPVATHAEVPDLLGASDVAQLYIANLPIQERHKVKCSPQTKGLVSGKIRSELGGLGITEGYISRLLGMALYESSGDLAIGSLITRWLPLDATVYLHYLTIDVPTIARHYRDAFENLSRYGLKLAEQTSIPPPVFVGMTNCPSDEFVMGLVRSLCEELELHPIRTRQDIRTYANLYTSYTVLLIAAGLGFRSRIDPKPNLHLLDTPFFKKGFACFADKQSTEGHFRVQIVPEVVISHLKKYDLFRDSLASLVGHDNLVDVGNPLFVYLTETGHVRPFSPSDITAVLGDRFPFAMNCFRRRMRSKMVAYTGFKAASLGKIYAIWMGHWTYWTNPFRVESGFNTRSMIDLKISIIEPVLALDGWCALEPRI